MKTFAVKEKRSAPTVRKARPYVHHPMGPAQQTQQAEIRRILRSTGAQAKLTIGQPNDKYEQEADHVADQVMTMPDPKLQRQPEEEEEEETLQTMPLADQITPLVQRQPEEEEEEEEIQAKLLPGQSNLLIQRQSEENEEEELVQAKGLTTTNSGISPSVASGIQSLQGGGQELSEATDNFFGPRFGSDFSQVRVHTDTRAAHLARSINARAFTLGRDVVFGTGEYSPHTFAGKKLLAHELTHVVQQGGAGSTPAPQRQQQDKFVTQKDHVLAKRGCVGNLTKTAIATPHLRSGLRISRHGGPLTITSLTVANATATAADPNTYVINRNAVTGNVIITATLNPPHGPADIADHNVKWKGGQPGANGLQRLARVNSAGRNRVRLTVDGTSSSVTIYVVNATPTPAANPPARLIHTLAGPVNPGANFGLAALTIGVNGIKRPQFNIVPHLNGNQWRFRAINIRHKYKVGIKSQGRRDISGLGDPDIRPNTIAQIVADLTPPAPGVANGPPRANFWSRRITRAHEEAHVSHFYNTPAFWPAQMAAFEAEVEALNINFKPSSANTRVPKTVLHSQRANWRTRVAHFHGLADAAEIPTSEVFCHGVSNPMYTTLLANIINTVAPPAPTNLVAAATSPNTVSLTWNHNHVNETGFIIERRQSGGRYTPIANVGTPPAPFVDVGLTPNTRYRYRIAAIGQAGSSPVSSRVKVQTPP